MAENDTIEGELRLCNGFVVTYYWTLPAVGPHLYTNIVFIIISVSSALLGSFANTLVVLSYFKNSRLRTLSNIPLLSLAFGDLMVTAIVIPLITSRLVKETIGTHNCILWTFAQLAFYFSAGVSLLTVTFISIERFITLAYPYRYHAILTSTRMNIVVANIWIFMFAATVSHPWLIPYKEFLAICGTLVVICIVIMLTVWTWVCKVLRDHKRRIITNQTPSLSSKHESMSRQQMHKNTRTSGWIVVGLIVSYIPAVLMLAYYWTEPTSFEGIFLISPWGKTSILVHSLFNPLYVFWRKSEFRHTAGVLVYRLKCCVRGTRNSMENEVTATVARAIPGF